MELPKRKAIRLPEHDYSAPGAYFVTICTHDRRCILSNITVGNGCLLPLSDAPIFLTVGEGLVPPAVELTPIGQCVQEQLLALPSRFPSVQVDHFVIMPNHVHLLLSFHPDPGGASPSPTLSDVVGAFKSLSTRLSRGNLGDLPLWQRSFHEHVIRNENDYREIWAYIDANPARWAEDRYFEHL